MDQAITRAAGAAPRAVGEFQGYVDGVDGIKPSVRWLDRKNMPQVGDRLFAIPARAAVPRSWSILLTSANHGTVGPVGSTFPHAGEKHERVQVIEIVEAGTPPAPGTDLGGLVRITIDGTVIPLAAPSAPVGASTVLTDERIADIANEVPCKFWHAEWFTLFARAIEREVAAQAKSEPLPDWISYDAAEDTLTMYGVKYSAGIFSTLGIAPVGRSFSIVARDNGVLVLTAAPVAAQAGQVAATELQVRRATDELSLPELAEQFAAVEALGCDYTLSAKVCGKLFRAMTTPPDDAAGQVAVPEWISVDERFPGEQGQDSEEVLCFLSGHCAMTDFECRDGAGWGIRLGYYDAEKGMFRTGGRPDASVTHWMPLPAAPSPAKESK